MKSLYWKEMYSLGLLLPLLLLAQAVSGAPSEPNPVTIPVTRSAAAATVQQFLTARAAGQYPKAYHLLSSATKNMLPLSQFEAVQNFPKDPTADGMTPLLSALSALFVDTHDALGYHYFVLGALPDAPNTTLVRARAPGAAAPLFLKVVTIPDPAKGGPRLDLMQSMMQTDARGMVGAQQKAEQITSLSNLRQIGLGVIQYAYDHHNTLPDAAKWMDELMPYLKNDALFHDPSAPAGEKWSYAFNRRLSGVSLAHVKDPSKTVVVFESTAYANNANDDGASVPRPGRHQGGTDYLFCDAHAKWLPDSAIVSYRLNGAVSP